MTDIYQDQKIEQQIELEAEAHAIGVTRYKKNLDQKGHLETGVGQKFMRATVPVVANGIETWVKQANMGGAGRRSLAVKYLEQIEPGSAAFLGIRQCLHIISIHKPLLTVALGIGTAIKEHVEWMDLQETEKGLVKVIAERIKKSQHEHYRRAVARAAVRRHGRPKDWGQDKMVKVGMAVIDIIIQETGMFEVRHQSEGRNRTRVYLQPTQQATEWFDRMHGRAEVLNPAWMPMVVPPRPWTGPWNGGYLTCRQPVVKTNSRPYLEELRGRDLSEVYAALNAVQETPWQVNKAVLDVLQEAWNSGDNLGGLPERDPSPLPAKPADIDTNKEALVQWKRKASEVHEHNAKLESKRLMVLRQIALATKFRDEPAIYFPHALDWRGRMYPMPTDVTPQGDDVSKALLRFARGKPLGEHGAYWLAVHIANLFGVDKVSYDDRVTWVQEHTSQLLDSAMDPLDGRRFWTTADQPWQALAACYEWMGYTLQGPEYVSHLPVAMDGSCNGLQNFSAMLRDPIGGQATNLVPQDKPADIYQEVAEVVQEMLEEINRYSPKQEDQLSASKWLSVGINRKLVKRPVMTLPYGATRYGMRDQLAKAARELELFGPDEDLYPLTLFLAKVVYEAIGRVVVSARVAMDWLQEVAKLAASEQLPVHWTAPSGLPVLQAYRKTKRRDIEGVIGGLRVRLKFHSDEDPIDANRQGLGIAPNLVHSMDASHLMRTVLLCRAHGGIQDFAMVHDSYGTLASDIDDLHTLLREAFVQQYSQPVLQRFREEIAMQLSDDKLKDLPEVPESGDLDLEDVRESLYFFA